MDQSREWQALATHVGGLYHCASCNYCVDMVWREQGIAGVCATVRDHSRSTAYTGKGYMATARALLEDAPLPLEAVAQSAWACTTCGNCEAVCPIDLQPMQVVKALRGELLQRGAIPPALAAVHESVTRHENPYQAPREARGDWALQLEPSGGEAVLLPGCDACHQLPGEARAAAQLLMQAGEALAWPEGDFCCGAPLAMLGDNEAGAARAAELTEAVAHSGARRLYSLGGPCLEQFAAAATDLEVLHPLQALQARLDAGALHLVPKRAALPQRVGCVDACHLCKPAHGLADRGFDVAMRGLLQALGCEVVEPGAAPRYAVCCGAAGGMPQLHPESATRMALNRLGVLEQAGAQAIVSADPLCVAHLQAAQRPEAPPVYGLLEFVAAYFEVSTAPAAGSQDADAGAGAPEHDT